MNDLLLIMLAAKPDEDTAAKVPELLAPILSAMAFILSASAFIFTVIIQLKERRRNLRQTLSTALSDIARINVGVAQLNKDEKDNIAETIPIRRSYNSQRGTLVSNADFLINENKKLVTDADCELMALTYDDLGEVEQAKKYWEKAIAMAPNQSQKTQYQRSYAAFLFSNNQDDEARRLFDETTLQAPENTDRDLSQLCHTYLTWAGFERDFGNQSEYDRLHKQAKTYCKKIRNKEKRKAMGDLIDHLAEQ